MLSESTDHPSDVAAHVGAFGYRSLTLETPFKIGPVNTYLLEGDRPALVDCGPNAATTLNELEAGLAGWGVRLGELETIVVTHHHVDHFGLAGPIVSRTGVEVACLDALAPVLESWPDQAARDDDYAVELMIRHGVDPGVALALRSVSELIRMWGRPTPATRPLGDGEHIHLGAVEFEVAYRPGHSTSDIVLYDGRNRIAVAGDHLLAETPSNAVISLPLGLGAGDHRRRPLIEYRESLRATRALDIDVLLGGHGVAVTDHRALIDERLARQERRAARFLEILGDRAMSAHQLATAQWGPVALTQAFATISEVLGHLDLLLAEGAILEEAEGEVTRFRRARG
jgi:glyoxylase-like metal-dependent hydrolase (beta-lactamase superfamily II)